MKILFVAHNNRYGGALQNVLNFSLEALCDGSNEYCLVLPSNAKNYIRKYYSPLPENVYFVNKSASLIKINKLVKNLELSFSPDLIYSMAGPNYIVNSNVMVVQGISDAFITHAKLSAYFKNRNFFNGITFLILRLVKGLLLKQTSDKLIFQTESAKNSFCKRYNYQLSDTFVIPNAINPWFIELSRDFSKNKLKRKQREADLPHDFLDSTVPMKRTGRTLKVLIPSFDYPHKNITFIKRVISHGDTGFSIEFVLTLPKDSKLVTSLKKFNETRHSVSNIGPYSPDEAPLIYQSCDIVWLPSVCETFSTSYIEAMALKKPLIVPKFDFSEEICGSYATYYKSDSVTSFIDSISTAMAQDPDHREVVGERILKRYGDQRLRYKRIVKVLEGFLG